ASLTDCPEHGVGARPGWAAGSICLLLWSRQAVTLRCVKPFSLDVYNAIPRVGSMVLSPDGTRLVLTVQELSSDGTRFVTSLCELRTDGCAEPRRLTFSDKGESSPAFLTDGSLVFASARPDPMTRDDESEGRVWCLPANGGEARALLSVPGGVSGLTTARAAP